jgi:hypothetical protein
MTMTTARGTTGVALACALAAVPAATARPGAVAPQNAKAVVAAASAYVESFRKDAAFLIADEATTQRRLDARDQTIESRQTKGEIFLTYLEADAQWIAVHDVASVDGEAVADREDLRSLLTKGNELRGVAQRVATRNARFNLGGVWRNFNEPTLPLLLLERSRIGNLSLDRKGVAREAGVTIVTVGFRERDRPTLVRGPREPIRAEGELVIEAESGRIRRTRFELDQDPFRAELVTTYALDARIGMWLPRAFVERYEGKPDGREEVIVCETEYTNYRKFTVTGRIVR